MAVACGGDTAGPTFTPTVNAPTAVLVGAGDIGECGPGTGAESTARLLDRVDGTVFTAGDNAYPSGRAQDFASCYQTSWGRHRSRTRPSPGNHDYETPGARDYFTYYGTNAGPMSQGYYSYSAGTWTIFALNSNVPMDANSAQLQWLQSELATAPTRCTMAIFHHSSFSSGPHGDHPFTREIWREFYRNGGDVVVTAHDHLYERFGPMNDEGRPDGARGMRLFVVGTGGARLVPFMRIAPNSEVRLSQFGVLKLTLSLNGYQWEFLETNGGIADSGVGTCR